MKVQTPRTRQKHVVVETDELRERMTALGVDFGQGFAIGRPVPLNDVLGDLDLTEAMDSEEPAGG